MAISKYLKFGLNLIKAKIERKYRPFLVQFSVTNRCNAKCTYCYARYYDRPSSDLSFEQIAKILNQLARAGSFRISLVGGEPLLRDDIGKIIKLVKDLGMECALTTNGLLVEKKISQLDGLDLLCISFDGDKKAHETNRGKNTFSKVMRAFELAKQHGIPLQASTVLTKHNIHQLDFILAKAREYDFLVGFTTLIHPHSPENNLIRTLLPSNQEYRQILEEILFRKRAGEPILFSEKALSLTLAWPDYSYEKIIGEEPEFPHVQCYAGKYYGLIDANSDFYPCPQLVDIYPAKNILRDGFDEAWKNLHNHNCRACNLPCNNELNLLFSLEPNVIFNLWKNYHQRR